MREGIGQSSQGTSASAQLWWPRPQCYCSCLCRDRGIRWQMFCRRQAMLALKTRLPPEPKNSRGCTWLNCPLPVGQNCRRLAWQLTSIFSSRRRRRGRRSLQHRIHVTAQCLGKIGTHLECCQSLARFPQMDNYYN